MGDVVAMINGWEVARKEISRGQRQQIEKNKEAA